MSSHFGPNLPNSVRVADRKHVNPILQGILYSTDRKAQVAVLQNESRRSSTSSTSSSAPLNPRKGSLSSLFSSRKGSVVSPDAVSLASYTKEKRDKSVLFGMASYGKNRGTVGMSHIM